MAEITGTESFDLLVGTPEDDVIRGLGGNDLIFGKDGIDRIFGDEGRDVIFAGKGADQIFSGQGNDLVFGGSGDDIFDDGPGKDTLTGGDGADLFVNSNPGDDLLIGGRGTDGFVFNLNTDPFDNDTIFDFEQEIDAIVFRPFLVNPEALDDFSDLDTNGSGILDQGDTRVSIIGSSTLIDFSEEFDRSAGSDTITVIGVTNLNSNDFLFDFI